MTLDDVTVIWCQIVDVTHPGLNTHLGLNTCKYSAWSRFILSVDMDLWKLHLLRWRHVTHDHVIMTRPLIVDVTRTGLNKCKVCLNMRNIWSWSNGKKFGFWPGKGSLKRKTKKRFDLPATPEAKVRQFWRQLFKCCPSLDLSDAQIWTS